MFRSQKGSKRARLEKNYNDILYYYNAFSMNTSYVKQLEGRHSKYILSFPYNITKHKE